MSDRCPNCGAPNFPEKENEYCEKCGFQNVKFKQEQSTLLIFCEGCGYHRTSWCDDHPREKQTSKG